MHILFWRKNEKFRKSKFILSIPVKRPIPITFDIKKNKNFKKIFLSRLEAFLVKKWSIFGFLIIFRRKHENNNIFCGIDLEMIEFYKKVKNFFSRRFFNQIYVFSEITDISQYGSIFVKSRD
jgi:hypothetical protein